MTAHDTLRPVLAGAVDSMDRTISLVVTVMDDGRVEFAWWRPEVDRYPSYRWYVSSVDECVWLMKAARTAIRELERRA